MAKQTFLSYKYFRDSAGVSYAILVSHDSDKVASVKVELGSNLTILSESVSIMLDGSQENVIKYKGSGNLTVTFNSSIKQDITISELPVANSLEQDFASLIRSFSFDVNSEDELGYSIIDSMYYSEGTQFGQLFIFPSSNNNHLDTSSVEDYYYTSDGAAAYIASTELQNDFLNAVKHTNVGSNDKNIGKPRGKFDNNTSINFTTTNDIDATADGPKVLGGLVIVDLKARTALVNNVCLDPRATNYYLKGCAGQSLPCTASTTMANDCDGVALTADKINSNANVDGGCCTYTAGCENFSVVLDSTTKADAVNITNGTATFTVSGGTANYSYTVDVNPLVGLDSADVSLSTISSSSSTDTFTVSGLYPGGYTISVTDSNSTPCTQSLSFVVGTAGEAPKGVYGCQSGTTAINYDPTAAEDNSEACVFCNDAGYLAAGTLLGNVLGPWVLDTGNSTTVRATSDGSGASLSKGAINFAGIKYPEPYTILAAPQLLEFKVSESFYSTETNPIDYKLYKITNEGNNIVEDAQKASKVGKDGEDIIAANATLITTASTTGGPHIFNNRAAGEYAIIVKYDVGTGAGNTSTKAESCYSILGPFVVEQAGCTDPVANNYNRLSVFDDGSCTYDAEFKGCTDPKAVNYNATAVVDDGSCEYLNDADFDVLGCTDPSADNYNPSANVDDGTCIYPAQGTYKCIDGKCQFIENNYTGSKTLEECVAKGCSGVVTDKTRLRDFSSNGFGTSSSNSTST